MGAALFDYFQAPTKVWPSQAQKYCINVEKVKNFPKMPRI